MGRADTDSIRLNTNRSRVVFSKDFGLVPLDFLTLGTFHTCPYLPENQAREEVFMAEDFPPELYHDFMDHGFRRSGKYIYRTACGECRECRSLRVPVPRFRYTKSFRRVINKNRDVRLRIGEPPLFSRRKQELYYTYLEQQHGTVDLSGQMGMKEFLYESALHTLEFQYFIDDRLVAVGILDECSRSLSSVYTYFDPEFSDRSLGTLSALREIEYCRNRGIPYYYLGFYVAGCDAMNYKARYRPGEMLQSDGAWIRFEQ